MRRYALALGLEIGAHVLCATAAVYAVDDKADIGRVQGSLEHANFVATRMSDRRKMQPEDSPTFKVSFWRGSSTILLIDIALRSTWNGGTK
jgi:integrase/recombinase XerD